MLNLRPSGYFKSTLRWSCRRTFTSQSRLPPLPPPSEWKDIFSSSTVSSRDRVSLRAPETAQLIAESFLSGASSANGEGKIVIEAFPGPGALSRALLELPASNIQKLIILEDHPDYLKYLKPLEAADSRVKVVPLSGFDWDTYSHIEEIGLLDDVKTVPWSSGLHPQLHFISHLQHTIKGEQLIAQLFRCIPDGTWLYKYGRVPMSFVLSDWVWERISAVPPNSNRCKLSVIAEATATCTLSLDPAKLLPYDDHFHPITTKYTAEKRPQPRRPGYPLVAMNLIPHDDQLITKGMLEKWDFCLRRLFVLKSTPLKKAISSLAPGAQTMLKMLTDSSLPDSQRVDIGKAPRHLTLADWALVIRAFDNWPFAPEDLMISDAFTRQNAVRVVL
ncbi:uncharacterized protein FIBRA_09176 [Fibroporia radiculosa]|uniref:rRNA adenine N(6)-methyltransferase n=1 Tax=Fibroporia radiculosa TaxID=599839 RepID=J4GJ28_9APHY|nr:uncharacterized protein FIBRA_09176 [Fibroporia radiculosa]CCM06868.1 predicted protein [Fibroporia radiculosa]